MQKPEFLIGLDVSFAITCWDKHHIACVESRFARGACDLSRPFDADDNHWRVVVLDVVAWRIKFDEINSEFIHRAYAP